MVEKHIFYLPLCKDVTMFKKIAIATVLAVSSTAAFADNDIGCGLGTQLWSDQKPLMVADVNVAKFLAGTTNGIFWNQGFGITFGTLGCNGKNPVTAQVAEFVEGNSVALARDVAVGQGENLEVLAQLLNIADADKAHFYAVAKANFGTIYADNATTASVVTALHQVMAQDSVLKGYTL